MILTPRMKSRSAPTLARAGPLRPLATMPPTVAPGPKCGGSKGRHWPWLANKSSSSVKGVPARAVTTSSLGS